MQHASVSLNVIPPKISNMMRCHLGPALRKPLTDSTGRRPGTVPRMAIPATRTAIGTSGRHTAVEIPMIDAPSSRPQSSRSNAGR